MVLGIYWKLHAESKSNSVGENRKRSRKWNFNSKDNVYNRISTSEVGSCSLPSVDIQRKQLLLLSGSAQTGATENKSTFKTRPDLSLTLAVIIKKIHIHIYIYIK